MQQRYLRELKVSAMGLGCMGMSEFYGPNDEQEALYTLEEALELGVNFWDTADVYGYGQNEKLLAKAMQGKRDRVILASKFGIVRDPNDHKARGMNGSADYVYKACEASLKRLKTDTIDLYYMHRLDPNVPIEETITAMAELVKSGKVRHIGLSEVSEEIIRRAHQIHPITAIQSEYSLMTRTPEENGVLTTCQELGIGFVPYSPLCRGLLTATQNLPLTEDDFRHNLPRFQQENLKRNQRIARELSVIADELKCTLAQLSLAWVMAQGEHVVPIPGTKRIPYLRANAHAGTIELNQTHLDKIDTILKEHPVAGLRYPENIMKAFQLGDEL